MSELDFSDEPTEEVEAVETPWQRLHPVSLAVNLVPRAYRVLRAAWPLFLALIFGRNAEQSGLIDLSVLAIFFSLTLSSTIVHYLTLRYRVHDGRLELVTGLLNRRVRLIDPRRIQNIELVRNVFHKVAGLVEVRVETASGTEVEGLLSALSEEAGEDLMGALQAARSAGRSQTEEVAVDLVVHNGLADLFRYGATATRVGAGMVVVFGLGMEGLQLLDPTQVEDVSGTFSRSGIVVLGLGVLTGTWLIGTVTAIVRYFNFQLSLHGDRLVALGGLFTQRRVELQLRKVQLITVHEPVLRRLAGFASVLIETAAAREGAGGTVSAEAFVPVVDRPDVARVVRRALPEMSEQLWTRELRPPHPSALIRRWVGGTWRTVFVVAGLSWWFFPYGLLSVILLPLSWGAAWLDHRHQGWWLEGDVLLSRQGYLDRRTAVVPIAKLQSTEVRQDWLRRRWGLGRLVVRVAGSAVALPDLSFEEALSLQAGLIDRVTHPREPEVAAK